MAKDLPDAQQIYRRDMEALEKVGRIIYDEILRTGLGRGPESLSDYDYKRKEVVWRLKDARKFITSVIGD